MSLCCLFSCTSLIIDMNGAHSTIYVILKLMHSNKTISARWWLYLRHWSLIQTKTSISRCIFNMQLSYQCFFPSCLCKTLPVDSENWEFERPSSSKASTYTHQHTRVFTCRPVAPTEGSMCVCVCVYTYSIFVRPRFGSFGVHVDMFLVFYFCIQSKNKSQPCHCRIVTTYGLEFN